MKTLLLLAPRTWLAACLSVSGLVWCGVGPAKLRGESPAARPYTLFSGVDVSVEHSGKLRRVENVAGGALVVRVEGEAVEIPTRKKSLALKIEHALKLARASAAVQDLSGERAYTPARDPRRKFMVNAGGAGGAAEARLAEQGVLNNYQALAAAQANPVGNAGAAEHDLNRSFNTFQQSSAAMGNDLNSSAAHARKLDEELALQLFDAMEISFVLSSEQRLGNPYVVVITRFKEKGGKPGSSRDWIYATAVDPVTTEPQRVRILQGGFPAGFEVEAFTVHLFNRGREVATNVSPRRVELSREEAFEYLLLDYLAENKTATIPATPALGELPDDLVGRSGVETLTQTWYVRVSSDGRALGVFEDEACARPVQDEYLRSVFDRIYFKPALQKGTPAEGVARVRLNQLASL